MTGLNVIGAGSLDELTRAAQELPRLRRNLNLHARLDDPVQRLFNAMEPGTYVRPHRHAREAGWECMLVVRGAFSVLIFDDDGRLRERVYLDAQNAGLVVEIPAFTFHSLTVTMPGTIMFEVKPGPYSPVEDKDFAAWAPDEGTTSAGAFRDWLQTANAGDLPPRF